MVFGLLAIPVIFSMGFCKTTLSILCLALLDVYMMAMTFLIVAWAILPFLGSRTCQIAWIVESHLIRWLAALLANSSSVNYTTSVAMLLFSIPYLETVWRLSVKSSMDLRIQSFKRLHNLISEWNQTLWGQKITINGYFPILEKIILKIVLMDAQTFKSRPRGVIENSTWVIQ